METKPVSNKCLIAVVGPTGIGKTDLAITLAQRLQTDIISADARQVYKGMCIGTAQPNEEQLKLVKHHFINCLPIETTYSAGQYANDVQNCIRERFKDHQTLLLVGGSGLYIKAVCEGLDPMPPVSLAVREYFNQRLQKEGIHALAQELERLDPAYYQKVDVNNPKRIIRALEIMTATGKPYSECRVHNKYAVNRAFKTITIGLDMERKVLYKRINQRVDSMMQDGLYQEAIALYPYRMYNSLQTVGYQEIFQHLAGLHTLPESIELIKRNSRRYAKRQLTWFRAQCDITWFHPTEVEAIMKHIITTLHRL